MISPTAIATIRCRIDCLIVDPENFFSPLRARIRCLVLRRGISDVLAVELPFGQPRQAVQLHSFFSQAEIESFGRRVLVNSPELAQRQLYRHRRGVKVCEFEFELLAGFHLSRHRWFNSTCCDADVGETPGERNLDRTALIYRHLDSLLQICPLRNEQLQASGTVSSFDQIDTGHDLIEIVRGS
ncbi:hypothetical protein ACVWXM_000916 [Bradyrhizobium sp. GM7.3]